MPGMGLVGHGGVSLPPPSHAINLPPPTIGNTWKPHTEKYTIKKYFALPAWLIFVARTDYENHLRNVTVTFPITFMKSQFQFLYLNILLNSPSMEDTLASPQRNVPVLGADIIAQTFAGNNQ